MTMVVGLLILAAIPTVTGTSLAISERNKPKDESLEKRQLRQFTLKCWCEGKSPGKADIHGGKIVLGNGKMYIQSHKVKPSNPLHDFEGFFVDYPDPDRPKPAPLGMVSRVEENPPLMNWIYMDRQTDQICHGNRTVSRPHRVGDWGWTDDQEPQDDENDPGGIEFDGDERFVALEPIKGSEDEKEGRWEVWWDRFGDHLAARLRAAGGGKRRVYGISLERSWHTM